MLSLDADLILGFLRLLKACERAVIPMKKKKDLPKPFVAATKDTRHAGTFEIFVPAPGRARPHRVPIKFDTEGEAERWLHSQEGAETVERLLHQK